MEISILNIIYRFISSYIRVPRYRKGTYLIKCKDDEIKNMYSIKNNYDGEDGGMDLYQPYDIILNPGEKRIIDLGVSIQLRYKICFGLFTEYSSFLLIGRSSLSKINIEVSGGLGFIDSGYTGNIFVVFKNTGNKEMKLEKNKRYVQLISPYFEPCNYLLVDGHRKTNRGTEGYGSTG